MHALAKGAKSKGWRFVVIGDSKSPEGYSLDGADFFCVREQLDSGLRFAARCPLRHYARKNIGYLISIRESATYIVETDDDNLPFESFFSDRTRYSHARTVANPGWLNVYQYFHDGLIWPRGFPLDELKSAVPSYDSLPTSQVDCPIQQGLADGNPDVDAIYRLALPLPIHFRGDRRVALGNGSLCPFNSQNTTWWPDAYPLLYLPAYCSFRMTDIWRSFVAERIGRELGWHILFHEATVEQERNEHNLMKDFADEIPGYLNNRRIVEQLNMLHLKSSVSEIPENLRRCYELLVGLEVVGRDELPLLNLWLDDIQHFSELKG
jgi:hypothetical protein